MSTENQKLSEKYKDLLKKSSTAYNPGVDPTGIDLELQRSMIAAQSKERYEQSQKMKEAWYGDESGGDKDKKGYLAKALHVIGTPIYGVVGAAEAVTGTGSVKGIANIPANIKEQGTFGDMLRGTGMNNMAAMPLGFALDLVADPLNWYTMGTTALIPRAFRGAQAGLKSGKGAFEGFKIGAKSGVLNTLNDFGKMMPGLDRSAYEKANKGYLATKYRNLNEASVKARKEFEKLTGETLIEKVEKLGNRRKLGDVVEEKLRETEYGNEFVDATKYSTTDQFFKTKLEDEIDWENKVEAGYVPDSPREPISQSPFDKPNKMDTLEDNVLDGNKIEPGDAPKLKEPTSQSPFDIPSKKITEKFDADIDDTFDLMDNPSIGKAKNSEQQRSMMAEQFTQEQINAKHIKNELNKIKKTLLSDDAESLAKLKGLTKTEKDKYVQLFENYNSNMKFYDKKVAKVLLSPKARKTFDAYAKYIGMFKSAKIFGGMLATGTNALVGNLLMTGMIGVNVLNTNFGKSMVSAIGIIGGKSKEALKELMTLDWQNVLKYYPKLFEQIHGINPKILRGQKVFIDEVAAEYMKKMGKQMSKGEMDELRGIYRDTIGKGLASMEVKARRAGEGGIEMAEEVVKKGTSATAAYLERGVPTTFASYELMRGPFGDFVEKLAKKREEGSLGAKLAHMFYAGGSEFYNKFDQTYKLGLSLHLANNGIKEQELFIIAKRIKLTADDIIEVEGRNLYKLKPMAAMKVANEAYMNYLAMPGFVQSMRTLPIIGNPFFCRSEDTEILTNNGWKKYNEIVSGDMAMSYNLDGKLFEWQLIEDVHIFDVNNIDMYHIKSRSLDIIASEEHDMVVARRENIECGKVNGIRKRALGEFIPQKMKMKELIKTTIPSIVVGAENGFVFKKTKTVSDEIVELVGWFVAEGAYLYKKVDGSFSSFSVSQAKPTGVARIKDLIKKLKIKCNIQIRKKESVKMANYDCYTFNFHSGLKKKLDLYAPKKQLTLDFLNILTKKQALLLYDILILADGTPYKGGNDVFYQNQNETMNSFQILTLMIGRSCTDYGTKGRRENHSVGSNKGLYRQIKRNMPKKIKYTGKIWCPQVANNKTWVARRNGRIDVTGNSFSYGMASLTGKTAVENTAFFNKIQFLLHEISGSKSPLEKDSLDNKYYEWLDRPGMLKLNFLPFMEETPVYLNMENMLPYYTMNAFQPTERSYEGGLADAMAKIIDKVPFFKTPEGQVGFDYVLQPMLMSDHERPKGMFNQPLWPENASLAEKIRRGLLSSAESVVPTFVGLAGLAIPGSVAEYMPSYKGRKLSYAKEGKSSIGIPSTEPAVERTMRTLAGFGGFPVYQMKLKYNKGSDNK